MNKEDSETHDMSSPKRSFHARRSASTTHADGDPSTATPAPVQQIGLSDVRETFDVPVQYY